MAGRPRPTCSPSRRRTPPRRRKTDPRQHRLRRGQPKMLQYELRLRSCSARHLSFSDCRSSYSASRLCSAARCCSCHTCSLASSASRLALSASCLAISASKRACLISESCEKEEYCAIATVAIINTPTIIHLNIFILFPFAIDLTLSRFTRPLSFRLMLAVARTPHAQFPQSSPRFPRRLACGTALKKHPPLPRR